MDREDGDQLVMELPGAGSLSYARFGDPGGVPCFAFHGQSSSRLMPGWMFPPELLTAAGVRMIGVDRPGYGLSSAPWAAGFADWPRAVGALADHLDVSRFAVLAHSLGSAYALACGPALGDRLAVIVLASGMGPLQPGELFRSGNRLMTCTGGWPAIMLAGCWIRCTACRGAWCCGHCGVILSDLPKAGPGGCRRLTG